MGIGEVRSGRVRSVGVREEMKEVCRESGFRVDLGDACHCLFKKRFVFV